MKEEERRKKRPLDDLYSSVETTETIETIETTETTEATEAIETTETTETIEAILTMATRQAQLNQLLVRFLGVPTDPTQEPDNIYRRLVVAVGATAPRDILRLTRDEITAIVIRNKANDADLHMTVTQIHKIEDLRAWQNSQAPTPVNWQTADPDDFESWADIYAGGPPPASPVPAATPAEIAAAVANAIPSADEVGAAIEAARTLTSARDTFVRGTKQSIEDYKPYKDKRQWNSWNRTLRALARQHGVSNVLDPSYVPDATNADAMALFDEQQNFLFAVFTATLKESSAMEILRQHSDPTDTWFGNAQGIYDALLTSMQSGVQAKLSAEQIERELTNMRLDSSWTKTNESFVNRIATLCSDHQNVVDATVYDDSWYIRKLESALEHNSEFRQFFTSFKVQEAQLQRVMASVPGAVLPARMYVDVLATCLDQAKTMDSSIKARNLQRSAAATAQAATRTGRGTPHGSPPSGRGRGRGRSGRGRGRGRGTPRNRSDWLSDEEYANLSPDERRNLYKTRE